MGGNQKANRTKGNTRPSSSGRSAQLLANSGVSLQGFIGFHSQPSDKVIVPVTGAGFEDDSDTVGLDGDFKMVMRKMSKRDVTTKLKALSEFIELCQSRDLEILKAVLPFWPRIYCKLAMDHNRKVREESHKALKVLADKVERNIAPFLKSLMEVWFIGTCDSYPPASSAAMNALKSSFSDTKLPSALMHCHLEIFNAIKEYLLNASSASIGDPKILSKEEMESKYVNVVSASLLSLSLFLQIINNEDIPKIKSHLCDILVNAKFWKFSKHKDGKIKASFFKLMTNLCQLVPQLVNEYASKTCSAVLSQLHVADPMVSPYIWEAALHVILTINDIWSHSNPYKVIIPQINSIVSNHGNGNAAVIYPNLLPLLSQLPDEVFTSDQHFMAKFMDSFKLSFGADLASSELNAIVRAYAECFMFAINKSKTSMVPYDVNDFVTIYFIEPLQTAIFDRSSKLSTSCLFKLYADILFEKKCDNELLLKIFWPKIEQLFTSETLIDSFVLDKTYKLILALVSPKASGTKKVISFQSESTLSQKAPKADADRLSHVNVTKLIENICRCTYENNMATFHWKYVSFMHKMLELCNEREIWVNVIGQHTLYEFSKDYLISWMQLSDADHTLPVIRLFFNLLAWVNDDEAQALLMQITQINSIQTLSDIIEYASCSTSLRITEWLSSDSICDRLCSCIQQQFKLAELQSNHLGLSKLLTLLFDKFSQRNDHSWTNFLQCFCLAFQQMLVAVHQNDSVPVNNFLADVLDLYVTFLTCHQQLLTQVQESSILLLQIASRDNALFNEETVSKVLECCEKTMEYHVNASGSYEIVQQATDWLKAQVISKGNVINQCTLLFRILSHWNELNGETQPLLRLLVKVFLFNNDQWKTESWQAHQNALVLLNQLNGSYTTVDNGQIEEADNIVLGRCYQTLSMTTYSLNTLLAMQSYLKEYSCHNDDHDECLHQICLTVYEILKTSVLYLDGTIIPFQDEAECENAKEMVNLVQQFIQHEAVAHHLTLIFHHLFTLSKENAAICSIVFNKFLQIMPRNEELFQHAFDDLISSDKLFTDSNYIQTLGVLTPHVSRCSQLLKIGQTSAENLLATISLTDEFDLCKHATLHLNLVNYTMKYANLNGQIERIIDTVFEFMLNLKQSNQDFLFYNRPFDAIKPANAELLSQLLKALTQICKKASYKLTSAHWDCLLCHLGDSIQSLQLTNQHLIFKSFHVKLIVCAIGQLLSCVSQAVAGAKMAPFGNKPDLVDEWNEFFARNMFSPLLTLFVAFCEKGKTAALRPLCDTCVLNELGASFAYLPGSVLNSNSVALKLNPEMEEQWPNLAACAQSLLNHIFPLLLSTSWTVQCSAYHILKSTFPLIHQYDSLESNTSADQDDDQRQLPAPLLNVLLTANNILTALTNHIDIEDTAPIDVYNSATTYITAYLCSWDLLLRFFSATSSELRSKYACFLDQSDLLSDFLFIIFKMMPPIKANSSALFSDVAVLSCADSASETQIRHLACNVYYKALKSLPALIRLWWNRQPKKVSIHVEKYTALSVSNILCQQEIQAIHLADEALENMTIKTRPVAKEVVATYTIDEVSMELVVRLPGNHPLGAVSVESGRRVGVANSQWRNWMLQLTTFLMHQNGSILEGLNLWKKNVDKRFEGVEECMICFYVLHGSTCQLPKLTCRTCKKKFHAACLYKWFNTSNKSSCPLCRNLF